LFNLSSVSELLLLGVIGSDHSQENVGIYMEKVLSLQYIGCIKK